MDETRAVGFELLEAGLGKVREHVATQPVSLRGELELDEPPLSFPIEQLAPEGANVVIVGAAKTGKSTLAINLAKPYATGESFLGTLAIEPDHGRLVTVNYEVGERQWRSWMRRLGLSPEQADRLSNLHLRGYQVALQTDLGREAMVDWLVDRQAAWLLLDPYQRVANVADFNDHGLAVQVLSALDEIKAQAGIRQLFLVVHTPWSDQERPAGARALENWADVLWIYTQDGSGNRFLRAYGRDVDFAETRVVFDPVTLALRLVHGGGGKADAVRAARAALDLEADALVTGALRASPAGLSKAELEARIKSMGGMGTERARAAIHRSRDSGAVVVSKEGPALLHRLRDAPSEPAATP
jgi:hypothetical protein